MPDGSGQDAFEIGLALLLPGGTGGALGSMQGDLRRIDEAVAASLAEVPTLIERLGRSGGQGRADRLRGHAPTPQVLPPGAGREGAGGEGVDGGTASGGEAPSAPGSGRGLAYDLAGPGPADRGGRVAGPGAGGRGERAVHAARPISPFKDHVGREGGRRGAAGGDGGGAGQRGEAAFRGEGAVLGRGVTGPSAWRGGRTAPVEVPTGDRGRRSVPDGGPVPAVLRADVGLAVAGSSAPGLDAGGSAGPDAAGWGRGGVAVSALPEPAAEVGARPSGVLAGEEGGSFPVARRRGRLRGVGGQMGSRGQLSNDAAGDGAASGGGVFGGRAAAPEPDAGSQGDGGVGTVMLDGHLVGYWLSERLAREAGRPGAGTTSFDPRQAPAWVPAGAL